MLIVRLYLREGRPKLLEREAINAGVNFVDLALFVGELRFLDDGSDLSFGLAHDAPVAAGIGDYGGKYGRGSIAVSVRGHHRAQRLGADQWRITWQDHNDLGIPNRSAGDL